MAERDQQLIRAWDIVHADPGIREIEREFDTLRDEITEPWINTPSR